MRRRTVGVVLGSILVGLLLGLAIRRARIPSSAPESGAQPSRSGVAAALLRAEIRDLDVRLGALQEEGQRIEQEKVRLAALSRPPEHLSPEEEFRRTLRQLLKEQGQYSIKWSVHEWVLQDPSNVGRMMKIAAAVLREEERKRGEIEACGTFIIFGYLAPDSFGGNPDQRARFAAWLIEAQSSETDALVRGWMLRALDEWRVELPAEQRAGLAKQFRESADPDLRNALLGLLMFDPASRDLVAEAIRENPDLNERSRQLLKAWDRRALPANELRGQVRAIMKSDRPDVLIEQAQDWVPKFINPLAPQETIGLFNGTLSKPIDPIYKAVSLMVMGSIASIFPGRPGRAEIAGFVESTDDQRLKDFGAKVGSLIDEGKSFAEIRKLNPLQHGFEYRK